MILMTSPPTFRCPRSLVYLLFSMQISTDASKRITTHSVENGHGAERSPVVTVGRTVLSRCPFCAPLRTATQTLEIRQAKLDQAGTSSPPYVPLLQAVRDQNKLRSTVDDDGNIPRNEWVGYLRDHVKPVRIYRDMRSLVIVTCETLEREHGYYFQTPSSCYACESSCCGVYHPTLFTPLRLLFAKANGYLLRECNESLCVFTRRLERQAVDPLPLPS